MLIGRVDVGVDVVGFGCVFMCSRLTISSARHRVNHPAIPLAPKFAAGALKGRKAGKCNRGVDPGRFRNPFDRIIHSYAFATESPIKNGEGSETDKDFICIYLISFGKFNSRVVNRGF